MMNDVKFRMPASPEGLNVNSPRCNRGNNRAQRHNPGGVESCDVSRRVQPRPGLAGLRDRDPRVGSCLAYPGLFTLKPSGLLVQLALTLLIGFQLHSAEETNSARDEIVPKVAAARAILDPWLAANPEPAKKKVHLVLWTPKDREPAPRYRERLSAIFVDIQKFYAREMERIGFGPRTIGLDQMDDGLLRVHLVRGLKDYTNYAVASGSAIRKECLPTLEAAD